MTDETSGHEAETTTPTSLDNLLTGASHEAHVEARSEPAPKPEPTPTPVAEKPPVAAATPAPPAPAAGAAPVDPAAVPEAQQPFWYRQELKKRKAAEEALQRELQELRAARPPPTPEAAPDPYEDPQGYDDRINNHLRQLEHRQNVAISERFARLKHGDETWEETHDWLQTRPDMVQWAKGQPDPCDAAIGAYRREKLAAEIGDDPAKWREAERQKMLQDPEVRAQILAEMGAQPGAQTPQTQAAARPAPPPGAATTRSAAPRGGDQSFAGEKAIGDMLPNKF